MSDKRDIQDSIQKLAGTYLKDIVSVQSCTVDSVDKDNRVCDCTPIGGEADTNIPGVQLCAENNNGLVVFPKVGSTVIVAQSVRNNTFVLMFSDVESIQFMDGTYGGIVKIIDLTSKLNNLKTEVQAELTKIQVAITALGGAYTPGSLSAFSKSDYENPLVTHGDV